MPYKTIKEVTALTGASAKALRYYNDKGLIHPTRIGTSGRREWLYDEQAIKVIRRVILYRRVGFTVDEIAKILEAIPRERHEFIAQKITELSRERHQLDQRISLAGIMLIADKVGLDEIDSQLTDEELLTALEGGSL